MIKTLNGLLLLFACVILFGFENPNETKLNPENGFAFNPDTCAVALPAQAGQSFVATSVLATGNWLKIKVDGQGIFKIRYSELRSWGFANPASVSVFGNGGLMLPKMVAEPFFDDLQQNPVWHSKGSNNEDCLFFYAPGTTRWSYASNSFTHQANDYSLVSYYFLTDQATPLLLETVPTETRETTDEVTSFVHYQYYEAELVNLIESGRHWLGEQFQAAQNRSFSFSIPNPVSGKSLNCFVAAAGRSSGISSFSISVGGSVRSTVSLGAVDTSNNIAQYANLGQSRFYIPAPTSATTFTLTYNASGSISTGWLDYIELNAECELSMNGSSMNFRTPATIGEGRISRFAISNSNSGTELNVWDVTNYLAPKQISLSPTGSGVQFKIETNYLREFVAFNPSGNIPGVSKLGEVPNQNLHSMQAPEMLIITHPDFRMQADELAAFHLQNDGLRVAVLEPEAIYNEFSSGIADVASIRNFIRCLYLREPEKLKYVLLLGDGHFDNRNILGDRLNFLPTYQSENSLSPTASFVSDDFFVLLDLDEGEFDGLIDLGIGRIPAKTKEEAQVVVDKIKRYATPASLGEWRNQICFIADDEDSNTHMSQADQLAENLEGKMPALTISKIYFDAFTQESSPSGDQYPDVTTAINRHVKNGVLVLNYTGHANQSALAAEKVLGTNDIDNWTNESQLPIFVTATCEFSRFDGSLQSGGEHILFNPIGGGIALFSTTRIVYSNPNFALNSEFYRRLFNRDNNGRYPRLGDVMKQTKNTVSSGINKRNFMLIGDPALRLAIPEYSVVTTSVNGQNPAALTEPIGALSKVVITGEVVDALGNRLSEFNGELIPVVYDKATSSQTLGNGEETPFEYTVQNNRIYKGLCSVVNGEFSFSFIVPKDINYAVGNGKIVYYAQNGSIDAHGATTSFLVGGASGNTFADAEGPGIELYLNTPSFHSGDAVGENSLLYLQLSDASGINTLGTGIGHDITAVLDGDHSNVIVLNDYYLSNLNDYTSGTVVYPINGLSVGKHTLTVKVWDVVNNSTEVTISFVVTDEFRIEEVVCYPNPASDYTRFKLIHNRPGELLDARIELFDNNGRVINQLSERLYSEGTETEPIVWQISGNQSLIRSGPVIYRVILKTSDGSEDRKSGILVILRK